MRKKLLGIGITLNALFVEKFHHMSILGEFLIESRRYVTYVLHLKPVKLKYNVNRIATAVAAEFCHMAVERLLLHTDTFQKQFFLI